MTEDPIENAPIENDALPKEHVAGYDDAPKWYWRIVDFTGDGWRGDVELWALFALASAVVALGMAILAVFWALS